MMTESDVNFSRHKLPLRRKISLSRELDDRSNTDFFQIQHVPKDPTPFSKLRKTLSDNENEIMTLKSRLQKEQSTTKELRNTLLSLNSDFRINSQKLQELKKDSDTTVVSSTIVEILIHHNQLLTGIQKTLSMEDQNSAEMERLQRHLESLKSGTKEKLLSKSSQRYLQSKLKYLQKEYTSLKDFITQEIDEDKKEEENEILTLQKY